VGAWLTVDEIAQRYTVKRSYAYRLACLRGWRRRRDRDRRVRYCDEDVEATLGRRRAVAATR
jgi:hypothetical protein